MALYDIVLGDFSGDGHEKTKTFYLQVDDSIPEEQLRANYCANSDLFGFSPSDFAEDYEDNVLPFAMYLVLTANGYQDLADPVYGVESIAGGDSAEWARNGYPLTPPHMFCIVAFYFTHQADADIPWQEFRVQSKNIIGWRGSNYDRPGKQGTTGVGYGLFY